MHNIECSEESSMSVCPDKVYKTGSLLECSRKRDLSVHLHHVFFRLASLSPSVEDVGCLLVPCCCTPADLSDCSELSALETDERQIDVSQHTRIRHTQHAH